MDKNAISDCESEENYQSYVSIPYGLQLQAEYCHASKHCDIQDITHNLKTNEYILLDSRGISSWTSNYLNTKVRRLLDFQEYKFNTLRSLLYSRHYNVYFALTKEYNLKVYNLNFHEISSTECDGSSVSKLLYNTERNELIGVCRSKLRFWKYSLREQCNTHGLTLVNEFKVAESLLVSNAEFDNTLQRIYLLCDNDVWCYTTSGRCVFHLNSQGTTYFSVCTFSKEANMVITGAINGQLSVYSTNGGLVATLLNHSRIVTAVIVHPSDGNMFLSASMDGTIKLFSLQMLGELASINVFPDGVYWMKLRSNTVLYCSSRKSMQLYNLNYTFRFWSTVRSPVKSMSIIPGHHGTKSYVLVNTIDNSIRLYRKQTGHRRCTILPPPEVSVNSEVLSIAFDRSGRVMYVLYCPSELWIYSTRTDPATRVATWNIEHSIRMHGAAEMSNPSSQQSQIDMASSESHEFGISTVSQREADENIKCCCLVTIRREIYVQDIPSNDMVKFGFLLCGLSNGIVSFLDPCDQGNVFKSLKVHNNSSPVVDVRVYYSGQFTHLTTLIRTITQRVVRIWNAETFECFYQVEIPDEVCVFSYKHFQFVAGEISGHLSSESIEENKESSMTFPDVVNGNMKEHNGEIFNVDILESRALILSCGVDGFIRIWNYDKTLLTEIKFDESLQSALFLNNNGMILISFKSHLFAVPYLSSQGFLNSLEASDTSGTESIIYEDPYVKKEKKSARTIIQTITLSNYLVPFPNLGLESLWMFERAIADQGSKHDEEDEEDNLSNGSMESFDSFASTQIYQDSMASEMSYSKACSQTNFPRCNSTPIFCEDESRHSEESIVDSSDESHDAHVDLTPAVKTTGSGREKPSQTNFESLYDQIRKKEFNLKDFIDVKKKVKSTQQNTPIKTTSSSSQRRKTNKKKVAKRTKKTKEPAKQASLGNQESTSGQEKKSKESVHHDGSTTKLVSTIMDSHISLSGSTDATDTDLPVLIIPDESQTEFSVSSKSSKEQSAESKMSSSNALSMGTDTTTFSRHHKSLVAMALGKSNRGISSSYQTVMKSLTKEDKHLSSRSMLSDPQVDSGTTCLGEETDHHSTNQKKLKEEDDDEPNTTVPRISVESTKSEIITVTSIVHPPPPPSPDIISNNEVKENIKGIEDPEISLHQDHQNNTSLPPKKTSNSKITVVVTVPSADHLIDDVDNSDRNRTLQEKSSNETNDSEDDTTIHRETPKKRSFKNLVRKHFIEKSRSPPIPTDDVTSVILNLSNKLREKQLHQQKMEERSKKKDYAKKCVGFAISSVSEINQMQDDSTNASSFKQEFNRKISTLSSSDSTRNSEGSEKSCDSHSSRIRSPGKISNPFKLLTEQQKLVKQLLKNKDISVDSTKIIEGTTNVSTPDNAKNASGLDEKKHVMSFILNAFKKPNDKQQTAMSSRMQRNRASPEFNFQQNLLHLNLDDNNNNNIDNDDSLDLGVDTAFTKSDFLNHPLTNIDSNVSSPRSAYFITPRTSMQYSPVSEVDIKQHSSQLNAINETGNQDGSALFLKLNKHRREKERRKSRQDKIRIQRSSSAPSSGYETASRDTLENSSSYTKRSVSASPKKRLTIKRSPLAIEEYSDGLEQVPIQHNNSERVYFEYANSSRNSTWDNSEFRRGHRNEDKAEKIRKLELKFSGQPFRCPAAKTDAEVEYDRITLMFLKDRNGKDQNGIVLKPPRTSPSIPVRCQYKLIKGGRPPSKHR